MITGAELGIVAAVDCIWFCCNWVNGIFRNDGNGCVKLVEIDVATFDDASGSNVYGLNVFSELNEMIGGGNANELLVVFESPKDPIAFILN